MRTTVTDFQRNFRKAREAADRGDTVIVEGESGVYIFERRIITSEHPFEGLEGVFGAVTLPQKKTSLRETVRRRLAPKNRRPRRRAAYCKAAIDRGDPDHAWAVRALRMVPGRVVTSEAAITEAQHGLENHPVAVRALRRLVARMDIVPVADRIELVFEEVERWAPRMDFADACAVVLARTRERAFVLTTDFHDFSTYRVPFASPEGAFFF